jgi:hypothetical protein
MCYRSEKEKKKSIDWPLTPSRARKIQCRARSPGPHVPAAAAPAKHAARAPRSRAKNQTATRRICTTNNYRKIRSKSRQNHIKITVKIDETIPCQPTGQTFKKKSTKKKKQKASISTN